MPDLNFADLRRDAESGVDVPEFDTLTQRARVRRRRRQSGTAAIAAAAVAVLAVVGGGIIDLNRADIAPADAPTEPPAAEQRKAQQDITSGNYSTDPREVRFASPGVGLVVFHTFQSRSYAATADGWGSIHYGILPPNAEFVTSLSDDTFFVRTPRGGLVIDPATGERRDIRSRPLAGVHSEHSLLTVAPHVGPRLSVNPLSISLVDKRHGTVAPMPVPGPVVSSSVVSHGDGERIWIVTKKGREQAPSLFYSDDHGANWHEAPLPVGLQARPVQVTVAARGDGMLAVKAFPRDRVYLSADSGRDWVAMDAPDASKHDGWIRPLADGRLYYTSWDTERLRFTGGYVSTNESWRDFTPLDLDSKLVATQSGALVRGKDPNLRVSWDGGSTWSTVDIPQEDS